MPDLDDEEAKRRAAATTPQQPAGSGPGPITVPPQNPVVPPVLASGGAVSPELEAARIANARHLADSKRSNVELTMAQKEERIALSEAQEAGRKTLANPRTKLSGEDRAFIDPSTEEGQRNLRRASDPAKKLGTASIDEARTMDLAERTGQLPGLVDRSGMPGADVKTTELNDNGEVDKETNWSMKAVRTDTPEMQATSMGVAIDELERLANTRVRGDSSPELVMDLKNIKDERQLAAIETQLQAQLAAQNQRIVDVGSTQQPIQMKTVVDEAILKKRQEEAAKAAAAAKTGGAA
jgi:hypothetical protein